MIALIATALMILFPIGYIIHDIFYAVRQNGWGYIPLSICDFVTGFFQELGLVIMGLVPVLLLLWSILCGGGE